MLQISTAASSAAESSPCHLGHRCPLPSSLQRRWRVVQCLSVRCHCWGQLPHHLCRVWQSGVTSSAWFDMPALITLVGQLNPVQPFNPSLSPPSSSVVLLLLQEEVHRSNVRPRPDGSEVYRGVSAPKRKAVNDAPQLEEMPKVRGSSRITRLLVFIAPILQGLYCQVQCSLLKARVFKCQLITFWHKRKCS